MAHYSKIFSKAPVQVQNKNGFDLSFENLFTGKCGTLVPIVCHPCIPGTKINYGFSGEIGLPPTATTFYGRIDYRILCFWVPNRILYGGWQHFITHDSQDSYPPGDGSVIKTSPILPYFNIPLNSFGAGSLSDFLGVKGGASVRQGITIYNPLPFLAYHKIFDDWIRDSRLQVPVFQRPTSNHLAYSQYFKYLPYVNHNVEYPEVPNVELGDGVNLYELRQMNWSKDYFTNSTLKPQAGNDVSLTFSTEGQINQDNQTVHTIGAFTIRGLRAANSIQLWRERCGMVGNRYGDQIQARFGVYPADAITDRCIFLGQSRFNVYTKSVYQTAADEASSVQPMDSIGTKYGSPIAVRGNTQIVNNYEVSEHGYFVVLGVLQPHAYYSSGVNRHLFDNRLADFADPLLAQVGDQEVYTSELYADDALTRGDVFGYNQRYAHYKYIDDQVHGLLQDGQSLQAFALQRSFDAAPSLGSSFLEIPTNYLDQVGAVSTDMSDYGYWADIYNDFKISCPLPAYSIPTLGQPMDTHTQIVDLGGKRL